MTTYYKEKALDFATKAHGEQKRKYTNDPYIVHPIEVADIVAEYLDREDAYIAALLHDVVEDTDVTLEDIQQAFGPIVAEHVYYLTDISVLSDGNRATRKEIDRKHVASGGPIPQTIKVADLISNTRSIVGHDPSFAKVYLKEKKLLLDSLVLADPRILERARKLLAESEMDLALHK